MFRLFAAVCCFFGCYAVALWAIGPMNLTVQGMTVSLSLVLSFVTGVVVFKGMKD